MSLPIEPRPVVDLVERFVTQAHEDAAKYENIELLNASQVHSLHVVAAQVYALGYADGSDATAARYQGRADRA